MTPEQARALFNEHREPGDLAHYGEKAAVAAILAAAQTVTSKDGEVCEKGFDPDTIERCAQVVEGLRRLTPYDYNEPPYYATKVQAAKAIRALARAPKVF